MERGVVGGGDDGVHPRGDLAHLGFGHAAAGDRWGTEADAGRVERLARIERDGVVVELDARGVERAGGDLAGDALGGEVGEDQVVVGAAGDERPAALDEGGRERAGVGDDLVGVAPELGGGGLAQRDGDAGGGVVVRAALQAGEHGAIDRLLVRRSAQDHAAARPAQGLVRGGGDHVGDGDRRGVRAGGDQAGDVGDIGDEDRADLAGDLGERGEVDGARDRGAAGEQEARPLPAREVADLVEVDPVVVAADAVLHGAKPGAGRRHVPAVRQVAAGGQRHAHHGLARLDEREVDGEVGRRARVGLDVGVVGAEQGPGARGAQRLDLIDDLLALVVALAGIALAVLVGQDRAGRGEHGGRRIVLRGDQPDLVVLPALLGDDQVGDLGIDGMQRLVQRGMHAASYHAGYARSGSAIAWGRLPATASSSARSRPTTRSMAWSIGTNGSAVSATSVGGIA